MIRSIVVPGAPVCRPTHVSTPARRGIATRRAAESAFGEYARSRCLSAGHRVDLEPRAEPAGPPVSVPSDRTVTFCDTCTPSPSASPEAVAPPPRPAVRSRVARPVPDLAPESADLLPPAKAPRMRCLIEPPLSRARPPARNDGPCAGSAVDQAVAASAVSSPRGCSEMVGRNS
jgi:hypothetical protein